MNQRNYATETKESLVAEQQKLEQKAAETDILRRETITLKMELHKVDRSIVIVGTFEIV